VGIPLQLPIVGWKLAPGLIAPFESQQSMPADAKPTGGVVVVQNPVLAVPVP
jgi:hypothetical protein